MSEGLFFTGTDTGVGKTVVTAAVARALRGQGHEVRVCKPVATEARRVNGGWLADDTRLLARAAGMEGEVDQITPWAFPDPVAPPLAARRQGVRLALAEIVAGVRRCRRPGVPLLVEGVGGLLCPLTEQETVADLARELQLPLVIVARLALGTLNHTLLTLEAAERRGLAVAGVVINATEPPRGLAEETNVAELRRRTPVPVLAVVPYLAENTDRDIPAIAAVAWRRFISRS